MPVPVLSNVTAGARTLASIHNSIKAYLDWLLNKPGIAAYRTVGGTVSGGWSNAIGLDQEDYKRDIGHNNASQNSRLVINTSGRYRITARIGFFTENTTGLRGVQVRANSGGAVGGGTALANAMFVPAVAGFATVVYDSYSVLLAAGDYIEMFGYQSTATAVSFVSGNRLTMLEAVFEGTS